MRAILLAILLSGATASAQSTGPTEVGPGDSRSYDALLLDPDVVFLRAVLTGYAKGSTKGISPVAVKGIQPAMTDGLRNFDKGYFKSRFIIVQAAAFVGGGRILSIVFVDRPDRVFDCWVFHTAGGAYELRAFTHDSTFAAEQLKVMHRTLLEDRKSSL